MADKLSAEMLEAIAAYKAEVKRLPPGSGFIEWERPKRSVSPGVAVWNQTQRAAKEQFVNRVARLIQAGLTTRQIAKQLHVTERSINHARKILEERTKCGD